MIEKPKGEQELFQPFKKYHPAGCQWLMLVILGKLLGKQRSGGLWFKASLSK
jgi:hypothetical protein